MKACKKKITFSFNFSTASASATMQKKFVIHQIASDKMKLPNRENNITTLKKCIHEDPGIAQKPLKCKVYTKIIIEKFGKISVCWGQLPWKVIPRCDALFIFKMKTLFCSVRKLYKFPVVKTLKRKSCDPVRQPAAAHFYPQTFSPIHSLSIQSNMLNIN